jgi:hypothetical protein
MESTARRTCHPRLWVTAWLLAGVIAVLGLPAAAQAHGPVDPAASSYQARVGQVPQGTDAKVVDGDLRMWMKASPRTTVTVLDYRGAPYLRFDAQGVFVNQASAMWYLNQVPAQTPPLGLTAHTPPRWQHASSGHSYEWHDGRLHALASAARAPGATFIGHWTVPLRVGGVPTAITGGLYYAPNPSPVWFWPIVVVAACVLAAVRLRRPSLDQRLSRGLATATLTAFLIAALARQLHGRPGIAPGPLIVLALEFAFAGWAAMRMARGGGWFVLFLIAAAAIWEGATLVGTLVYGFVLLALPAFPARLVVVACLAGGVGLLPVVFALAERPQRPVRLRPQGGRRAADGAPDSLEPSL